MFPIKMCIKYLSFYLTMFPIEMCIKYLSFYLTMPYSGVLTITYLPSLHLSLSYMLFYKGV